MRGAAKPWVLFALIFQSLNASQTYQIKYEPITRQCDFFIGLEYVAHFDLKGDDTGCMFILPSSVRGCSLIHVRNASRSEIRQNSIILEPKLLDTVAFNGYVCQ